MMTTVLFLPQFATVFYYNIFYKIIIDNTVSGRSYAMAFSDHNQVWKPSDRQWKWENWCPNFGYTQHRYVSCSSAESFMTFLEDKSVAKIKFVFLEEQ